MKRVKNYLIELRNKELDHLMLVKPIRSARNFKDVKIILKHLIVMILLRPEASFGKFERKKSFLVKRYWDLIGVKFL